MFLFTFKSASAQTSGFVHPGIYHKKSDLDRMKYMVEAGIEPYKTSFENFSKIWHSSYDYTVRKDPSNDALCREGCDNGIGASQRYSYEDDVQAARHNAIMWYITGDERHAEKAIEILNAWSSLKSFYGGGTEPLSAGLYATPLVDAAEIMKHTYDGWAEEDIKKFGDMLVYPGYSNTIEPTAAIAASRADQADGVTFYWSVYQGDPGRAGNQGLLAWRSVMAIGIFLDNEIIYERGLRQVQGMAHRSDDFAYPSGPAILLGGENRDFMDYIQYDDNGVPVLNEEGNFILEDDSYINVVNEHFIDWKHGGREDTVEDWGYDDQIQHYILENGQCEENSRDPGHSSLGIGCVADIAEIAWNQGDDVYSYLDDRLLLGLEYTTKYNLSYLESYSDQLDPWEPTTENGEYIRHHNRTGRREALKMNPYVTYNYDRFIRGNNITRPVYEMQAAHYNVRAGKEDEALWINRAIEKAIELTGTYEVGEGTDAPGWGGLVFHRPEGCAGDPVSDVINNIPSFSIPVLPYQVDETLIIEAENYDYFSGNADGRTYHETTEINISGEYRVDNETTEKTAENYINEGVDIKVCSEGGYNIDEIASGEWITYTVNVPIQGNYDLSIRYASANADGQIKFNFNGEDVTEDVSVPFGGSNSTGLTDWKDFTVATSVVLNKGVQSMKVFFNGADNSFELNNFKISLASIACQDSFESDTFIEGINYKYYEGVWDELPDFDLLTPEKFGITDAIDFTEATERNYFGMVFDGYIYIEEEGDYTFYLASDEGSKLSINGIELINNDGIHTSDEEKSAVICLQAGAQYISLEYFDKDGGQDLSLMYEGSNITKRVIENYYSTPVNLALNGIAVHGLNDVPGTAYDGFARLAIDGNTDGTFGNGSVTHTNTGVDGDNSEKFWRVTLEEETEILEVKIYNRTDSGTMDRLTDFTVDLITLDKDGEEDEVVFTKTFEDYPDPSITIDTENTKARRVKIYKRSNGALSLAEVEVYGGNVVDLLDTTDTPSSVEEVEMSPNPVEENLTIYTVSGSKIQVYDTLGELIIEHVSEVNNYELDMSALLSGIYFVRVTNGSNSTSKTIIKN